MVAVILVLKLAINTFTRLMSIQIDEDSGMTQSRISSTVATNNSSLRFDDRFFCNQINGPTWISLLFFDHESSRPRIIFIPLLSCMSYLVGHCQSLKFANIIRLNSDGNRIYNLIVERTSVYLNLFNFHT